MQLEPVPGEYRPPGLEKEPVYYVDIDKKLASTVILATRKLAPPRGALMQHIKRVIPCADDPAKVSILLCEIERVDGAELKAALEKATNSTVEIKESTASKYPARSSEEAEEWGKIVWPLMWRGNVKAKEPEISAEDEKFAVEMLLKFSEPDRSQCSDQCIIVDPKTREIVGDANQTASSLGHPLRHAVMEAIESVAQRGRSGSAGDGYLCLGLDVFCSMEPCAMCCMALVHSRIGRLFFLRPSQSSKGAVVRYCLHNRTQLNHTYEAWCPHIEP